MSPQQKRIYPNAMTGTGLSGAGLLVASQREGLEPGQSDQTTWNALVQLGWIPYNGPAKTDERGYVIPSTMPPPPLVEP